MTTKATAPELPGFEGSAIKPLERAAAIYETNRDARLQAGRDELASKGKLIDQMHKADKTHYRRLLGDGFILDIKLTEEKESVKVSRPEEE